MMLPPSRTADRRGPFSTRRARLLRAGVALLLVASLGGCAAVGSVNSAARNLDAYELNPLPPVAGSARPSPRVLFVAEPVVSGAIGSERIVIKPDALQVAFLGDGRWVEPAPLHIRNLLARSFANSGSFTLVTTSGTGPLPDFALLADVDRFEAERLPAESGAPARVVVSMTLTVVRDADARLIATRRFVRVAEASGTRAPEIAAAFDAAMTALLSEATQWGVTTTTGRRLPGV